MKELDQKSNYELSFLVINKGDEEVIEKAIHQHGAEVIKRPLIVEIKLSYPIKKHRVAHFGFLYFASSPKEVEKITHDLKLNPVVLRILVITPPIIAKSEDNRRMKRAETNQQPVEKIIKAPPVSSRGVLTNKDLEEKLEEILK